MRIERRGSVGKRRKWSRISQCFCSLTLAARSRSPHPSLRCAFLCFINPSPAPNARKELTATFVWYAIASRGCQLGTRARGKKRKKRKILCHCLEARRCASSLFAFFLRRAARCKRTEQQLGMVANVPLWVTCAVLSNAIGLAFALTALVRLGWRPFESLKRLLCFLRKPGAESGNNFQQFRSNAAPKDQSSIGSGEGERENAERAVAETLEDGKPTTTSTTAASGLSLAFLRARARAASGLTKDDADSSAPQEFHGGVLGQPWQRGCACEVRLIGKSRRGALASLFFFAIFLALTDSSSPSSRRQAANFFLFLLSPRGPLLSLLSLSLSQRRALSFGRHLTKKLKQTEKNRESATARLAGFPLPPPPPPPPPPP